MLETEFYSKLDGHAASLTADIITILDGGDRPMLRPGDLQLLWQFFLYNAFKRHPKTLQPYIDRLDFPSIKQRTTDSVIAKGIDPLRVRHIVANIEFDDQLRRQSIQMARAVQPTDVLDKFKTIGVTFSIATTGASYILPDLPIENMSIKNASLEGMWIPIHPKYAICPTGEDGQTFLVGMNKNGVRQLNERWYNQSTTSIAQSKLLLTSLAKQIDCQNITF